MEHYLYHFKNVAEEEREILIAVLSDLGFSGFEELDKDLLAYIPEEDEKRLPENVISELSYDYYVKLVEMQNWNQQWESSFQPVLIPGAEESHPLIYIHASFHEPHPEATYNISITPKMSFGTGHHETTFLMMETMPKLTWENKTVVDFGTGTGVLAILAHKLGSRAITAIDYDEWCIKNSKENFEVNNTTDIKLVQGDFYGNYPADIILANINLNIILDNLEAMLLNLKPGGTLLLSGMLLQDEEVIKSAILTRINAKLTVMHRGNWIMVRLDMDNV